MKNSILKFTVILLWCTFSQVEPSFSQYYSSRHLTRGADTAEIYLSCQWYADPDYITWNGIFHSTDNGQTLSVQRKTNFLVESGTIFGDSATGVLYQIPFIDQDTFGVSSDYGVTFEKKYFNDIYKEAAGCMAGELYISGWGLYRGTDYGNTFTFQSNYDSLRLQDVGTLPGELYWLKSPVRNPLKLAYSNDFGQTYSIHEVILPGISTMFDDYAIHRGTEPGEIYFVIWPDLSTFKIFHSFDYGQTTTFQSSVDTTSGEIFYTAGRTPGTFYYVRREICGTPPCLHSCLWIYFSRDYGVTFNTYFHSLDSVYTGVPRKDIRPEIQVFPNPATDRVTFRTGDVTPVEDTQITLYDLPGNAVTSAILKKGQPEMTLDVRGVAPGVYYFIINQKQYQRYGKVVIVK
jgi:hypothetical protein